MAFLVELFQLLDSAVGVDRGASSRPIGEQKFAELCSPVTQVVDPNHPMAQAA